MAAPKYGRQIRTHHQCKICQSPKRAEIEDVIYLQQAGLLMADGVRPTHDWIEAASEGRWGVALNRVNVLNHYRKHFEPKKSAALATPAERRDVADVMRQALAEAGIQPVIVEEFLGAVVSMGFQRLKADPSVVTIDHALKAVAELTKRKHDETTAKLMAVLATSTEAALGAVKRIPLPEAEQPADVIDVEVEEVPVGHDRS